MTDLRIPDAMRDRAQAIIDVTDAVCHAGRRAMDVLTTLRAA
jgi:hypothetical protein